MQAQVQVTAHLELPRFCDSVTSDAWMRWASEQRVSSVPNGQDDVKRRNEVSSLDWATCSGVFKAPLAWSMTAYLPSG